MQFLFFRYSELSGSSIKKKITERLDTSVWKDRFGDPKITGGFVSRQFDLIRCPHYAHASN